VVHHKAFGYRNLEGKTPLRRDDIFRMASQTKPVTTVALLMLMEEGRFLLDDPVSRYMPAFKNPKVLVKYDSLRLTYTTRPAKSEITIRQLLTHTAGHSLRTPAARASRFCGAFF
jgi:CubicO group peptidase (beta-lactamase class C family)